MIPMLSPLLELPTTEPVRRRRSSGKWIHAVVIVDDEPAVLDSVRRALRHEPYLLFTTTDPHEALTWMSILDVSVVVADQRMPVMEGTELLDEARRVSPTTLGALLTAFPSSRCILDWREGRVRRLMTKPWSDDELRETIHDLLRDREEEFRRPGNPPAGQAEDPR